MGDINHEFRTLDNRGEATRFEYPIETVRGEQGEPGKAATITVGTTTTGEAGSNAFVENVGNNTDAVLKFTIPKGDKGEPGQAATVSVGTTTTGEAGSNAFVENVGDTTDAVLNFTIPKGDKGEVGASPTVGEVVAHSASPESEPAVQIDDENHVLNFTFTIPQGVKGDTGATGAPGLPAIMEAVAVKGDEAHAEVELKDPGTNTYTLKLTLPKGEKGDMPEIPEVVIDSVQWVDTPEEASITPTYDKDHNILNVAFKLPHWKGEKGENGVSITFGGVYETLDEAPQQPELNTLITVGVEHHQDLYIYDGAQWQKLGSIAGEKGEQGIQGKAGQSVKFIGYFNGVEDIVTKVTQPELNDMAVVTKEEGARYLALYTGNDWVDLAKISGEKGEPGEPGEPGKPAIIDEVTAIAGDEAGAQLTRLSEEDNTYSILFTVPAGKDGKDGKDGAPLTFESLTDEQKDELRGANGDSGAPAIIDSVNVREGESASANVQKAPGTDNSYVIDFTIPKGDKGEPGKDGSPGEPGKDGAPGEPGKAATITVGTTTTGEPESNAFVENVGNTTDAVLEFTIPRGEKGEKGEPGKSATITVASTVMGEPGTDAKVENLGDGTNASFLFTIPRPFEPDEVAYEEALSEVEKRINRKISNLEEAYPSSYEVEFVEPYLEGGVDMFSKPGTAKFTIPVNRGAFFYVYKSEGGKDEHTLPSQAFPLKVYQVYEDTFKSRLKAMKDRGDLKYNIAKIRSIESIFVQGVEKDFTLGWGASGGSTESSYEFAYSVAVVDDEPAFYGVLCTPLENEARTSDEVSSLIDEVLKEK